MTVVTIFEEIGECAAKECAFGGECDSATDDDDSLEAAAAAAAEAAEVGLEGGVDVDKALTPPLILHDDGLPANSKHTTKLTA